VGSTKDGNSSSGGGCPFGAGRVEPREYGASELSYNDYLKVPELLRLQVPQSDPAHHDEMLFIVIHQAYELWFRMILHEMDATVVQLRKGEVLQAHHFTKRIVAIMKLLVDQIHLLETMTPVDFLEFRDRLMPASGFQSLQFREVEFRAGLKDERYYTFFKNRPEVLAVLQRRYEEPDLREEFYAMLSKQGFKLPANASKREGEGDETVKLEIIEAIRPVYQKPQQNLALYLLAESLVEFDEYLALWREHHVRVVERVIGFKRGTGGSSGVEYLRSTTTKKCFPCLWEVRTHLQKGN
jgi:tryptophan 2,3-dioxygenase